MFLIVKHIVSDNSYSVITTTNDENDAQLLIGFYSEKETIENIEYLAAEIVGCAIK